MLEHNLEVDLGNFYSNSYIVYIGIYQKSSVCVTESIINDNY